MSDDGYIKTAYDAGAEERPLHRPLAGDQTADVVVIGGGLAGLTTALELARAGASVVLLESNRLGWAASGRNGGFVSGGFAEDLGPILRRVGVDQTRTLYDLASMGRDYVRHHVDSLPDENLLQGEGGLSLMRHGGADGFAASIARRNEVFGDAPAILTGEALRAKVNSPRYHSGVFKPDAFHINPLAYGLALARAAQDEGATLYENSPVEALSKVGNSWKAATAGGTIIARHAVIASSAYGGPLGLANRAMVKVATYVVATEPLGARLDDALPFTGTVSDTRRAGDYFRTIGKGDERRLIWGGRISTRQQEPRALARKLAADMADVFPQLTGAPIASAWSGLMGYPRHKMPLIGEVEPGLWLNTGFGGHGLNTTAMGGVLVASAIASGDERWRAFAPFGPVWTGGLVGRVAVQTIYWAMQAQDRWDERGGGHQRLG